MIALSLRLGHSVREPGRTRTSVGGPLSCGRSVIVKPPIPAWVFVGACAAEGLGAAAVDGVAAVAGYAGVASPLLEHAAAARLNATSTPNATHITRATRDRKPLTPKAMTALAIWTLT